FGDVTRGGTGLGTSDCWRTGPGAVKRTCLELGTPTIGEGGSEMLGAEELAAKVKELVQSLEGFSHWDAETNVPHLKEFAFDDVWKLVVVWEGAFQTVKIHRRLKGQ